MKKALLALLFFTLSFGARAQFTPGQVLTAQQLNTQFALYLPIAGGTLTGPLTVPSITVIGGGSPITGTTGTGAAVLQLGATIVSPIVNGIVSGTAQFSTSGSATFGSIAGTPISGSTGQFTTLTSPGATLASPTLTGTPIAPTQAPGTSNTTIATTNYVTSQIISGSQGAAFTTLSASGTVSGAGFTTLLAPFAPIASPTFTGTVTIPAGASISGFAPLASPTFTGTPLAPTPAANTNSTQIATTAFMRNYLAAPIAGFGTTTPNTGAFTTLSASSTVSGAGFTTLLASPPAIGSTAPSTGAFTTLSASANDALLYNNSSATSVPNSTATAIPTWTLVSDRLATNFNASTGVFTAPATGIYQVSGQVSYSTAVGVVGAQYTVQVAVNGTATGVSPTVFQESISSTAVNVPFSQIVSMTAGNTLTITAFQTSGAARTLSPAAGLTYVSINRIP